MRICRLAVAVAIGMSAVVHGVTINVTSTQDVRSNDGVCTLREAIIAANEDFPSGGAGGECPAGSGPDSIVLTVPGVYGLVILGSDNTAYTGDLDITEDLEIDGLDRQTRTINGNGIDRLFQILSGITVTLENLTVTGGARSGFSDVGGGILSAGTLYLQDAVVASNQTPSDGGGVYSGYGTILQVTRVIFRNNRSTGSFGNGGALFGNGQISVTESDFDGNQAGDEGGAISLYFSASGSVSKSTFLENTAEIGGGISTRANSLVIFDSTFAMNAADYGGALYTYNNTTVRNSTFSENIANTLGGGVYADDTTSLQNVTFKAGSEASSAIHNDWEVELTNSIISGRCGGSSPVSLGGNLEGPGNTCDLGGSGDASGVSTAQINLLPLALNGGATPSHLPGPGSLALESGQNTGCQVTDQRGVSRPQDFDGVSGATCDRGSIEMKPCTGSDILTFQNTALGGSGTATACQEIRLGPDLTITASAQRTFSAGETIVFRDGTTIENGATATFSSAWGAWEVVP